MNVLREGQDISPFITCPEVDYLDDRHLMTISYMRTSNAKGGSISEHPQQRLDVRLSLISYQIAPTSILTIYDFVTTTFNNNDEKRISTTNAEKHVGDTHDVTPAASNVSTRIAFTLAGIQGT